MPRGIPGLAGSYHGLPALAPLSAHNRREIRKHRIEFCLLQSFGTLAGHVRGKLSDAGIGRKSCGRRTAARTGPRAAAPRQVRRPRAVQEEIRETVDALYALSTHHSGVLALA
ncbi:hypothetical protein ACVI1J_009146 [Bradyrhizobium diazoefficiens]